MKFASKWNVTETRFIVTFLTAFSINIPLTLKSISSAVHEVVRRNLTHQNRRPVFRGGKYRVFKYFVFTSSTSWTKHVFRVRSCQTRTHGHGHFSFVIIIMVACFHHMVNHGQGTTWRSPSLSRSNTWPLSSSWNSSAHLDLVCELWRILIKWPLTYLL